MITCPVHRDYHAACGCSEEKMFEAMMQPLKQQNADLLRMIAELQQRMTEVERFIALNHYNWGR